MTSLSRQGFPEKYLVSFFLPPICFFCLFFLFFKYSSTVVFVNQNKRAKREKREKYYKASGVAYNSGIVGIYQFSFSLVITTEGDTSARVSPHTKSTPRGDTHIHSSIRFQCPRALNEEHVNSAKKETMPTMSTDDENAFIFEQQVKSKDNKHF